MEIVLLLIIILILVFRLNNINAKLESIESDFKELKNSLNKLALKNNFELPQLFEKEITIEIDNQDNPALEITSIDLAQLPVYLVADLKTNQNYTLKTGNATLSAPSYDLANNANSNLPTASFSELNTIENQHSTQNTNTSFWQNKYFLWFCIAAAGLVTFYFSASLLKDMKQ
jgi:hypothetical protein